MFYGGYVNDSRSTGTQKGNSPALIQRQEKYNNGFKEILQKLYSRSVAADTNAQEMIHSAFYRLLLPHNHYKLEEHLYTPCPLR